MEQIVQLNSQANLSEHFVLGEMTRSNSHPEVYNIPTHEAIANLYPNLVHRGVEVAGEEEGAGG